MPIISIYTKYAPTGPSRLLKLEALANSVVDDFKNYCESMDAPTADDVEFKIQDGINPHIWEPVKRNLPAFENGTKLTIFESTLMTVKRRDKIIADRPVVPPAPVPVGRALSESEDDGKKNKSKK